MPVRRTALLLLVCALASCRSQEAGEDMLLAIRQGRYQEAVELAEAGVRAAPDDPVALQRLATARVAAILDRGRRVLFAGHAEDALQLFYSALEVDPENPYAATWVRKTRNQLAEHWLDHAQSLTSADDLDEAEESYEKVLSYVLPQGGEDDPALWIQTQAKNGLARVLLRKNYRLGQSQTYYQAGVNAFRNYLLHEAGNDFDKSELFGGNEEARDRRARVGSMLAQERLAQARELEAVGLYFAARNEYRLVLLIEPENEAAKKGLARMDRETRASTTLTRVEMGLLQGRFDESEQLLDQAAAMTTAQADDVALYRVKLEDARLRKLYEEGLTLERDYRFREAIAAYDRLLEQAEYYEDVIARRKALQSLIDDAEALWARADEASDDEERYAYLWEIQNIVWPEYRDVEERLAALRAQGIGEVDLGDNEAPERKDWTPKWGGARRRGAPDGSDGLGPQQGGAGQPQGGQRRDGGR